MIKVHLERRLVPSTIMVIGAPVLALAATIGLGTILFLGLGIDPLATLYQFFWAPLTTPNGLSEWLLKASPLILIALGLSVGFRANVWNIGAEGMFIMGAIAAGLLAIHFGEGAPVWLLPAMVAAGALGGMAWAAIPAFLRIWANASEILVSLMLNYVAQLFLAFLVNGPLRDPDGFNYPQSPLYDPSAMFSPLFDEMRLNSSIFITIGAVAVTWIFLERSFLGFQMTVGGIAPVAARYAGFSQARAIWTGLLAGGAAAGIAGMMEVSGPLGQLTPVISPGYGYVAIIVAFIGRLNAFGIVVGGLLLSLLYMGGESVQIALNIPSAITRTFQGMLLFFLLAADVLIHYRIRLGRT